MGNNVHILSIKGKGAGFYSRLQRGLSYIYTSDKVTHVDVLNNIEIVMSSS
ncbi:MAG: hypothetical protein JRF30_12505 [Deltaproteobacteria bacterium]|nr:hypothetical protein [Deltaproteobacteria bacterium]MBW1795830.1 hypothetical protein [Deltaproteobacteria bacterium]MBW2331700.1 hypothetical protein [Deltaproteobacteria bacterium]